MYRDRRVQPTFVRQGTIDDVEAVEIIVMSLKHQIDRLGMSDAAAASVLGVTEARVSDLMHERFSLFELENVVDMSSALHRYTRSSFLAQLGAQDER